MRFSNFIFLFLLLILIPTALADYSYHFKQYAQTDLKVSCFDINKSFCGDDVVCDISINYPNLTSLITNGTMTYSYNFFNYTLDNSQTKVNGIYPVVVHCSGDSDGYSTFSYKISPTGFEETSILNNPMLLIFSAFSLILLFLSLYTRNAYLGFISGMIFMFGGVYVMIYGFNDITSIYTRGIASVFLGLGLFFTIVSVYEWILGD